jgi:hypothetical protein
VVNNMNINFTFIVFQYSSGFRLEFELFKEIQLNSLNQIDVENTLISVPKLNMHVGLETRNTIQTSWREKKLCRVSRKYTRQKHSLPSV